MLDALLATNPFVADTAAAWLAATAAARTSHATTVDRALVGGTLADRLGFAFASGYAEALRSLVPSLTGVAALCATEADGNHPRAIRTRLDNGTLTGHKRWATGVSHATSLLVVATTGDDPRTHRPILKLAQVSTRAPNLRITSTAAPFVPEIEHAELHFEATPIEALLPGDGYADYLKPFRTVEDLHVHAALIGYLIGVTRRFALRPALTESLLALASAARALLLTDPRAAEVHLALAGFIDLAARTLDEVEHAWSALPTTSDEWQRWRRDRPLLQIAANARAARRDKARAALLPNPAP